MTVTTTMDKPERPGQARGASEPSVASKKTQQRSHNPGGARLGLDHSREAQRLAAAILEVLAGARTPGQAAQALGVSVTRYYQLEGRAMRGLVASCEAAPKGRQRSPDRELAVLRRQQERIQRELTRQQTLVRLARRSIGLPPAPANVAAPASGVKGKRRRRPVVRALRAAAHLRRQDQDGSVGPTVPQGQGQTA